MMFYENAKAIVHSHEYDIDFFGIVSRVLQRNKSTPYLFIIFLDKIVQALVCQIKDFSALKKGKKRTISHRN